MLRNLWSEWLRIARHIGSFNARALITLVYFTLLAPFGLLYHAVADVLHVKKQPSGSVWLNRPPTATDLETARRQG
ncbi:MAG TPA: hypothetical protein G4N94_02930 [Caldilineae bacterium]|nr:hypothetical protein [Caldilineae bacterium]